MIYGKSKVTNDSIPSNRSGLSERTVASESPAPNYQYSIQMYPNITYQLDDITQKKLEQKVLVINKPVRNINGISKMIRINEY